MVVEHVLVDAVVGYFYVLLVYAVDPVYVFPANPVQDLSPFLPGSD